MTASTPTSRQILTNARPAPTAAPTGMLAGLAVGAACILACSLPLLLGAGALAGVGAVLSGAETPGALVLLAVVVTTAGWLVLQRMTAARRSTDQTTAGGCGCSDRC